MPQHDEAEARNIELEARLNALQIASEDKDVKLQRLEDDNQVLREQLQEKDRLILQKDREYDDLQRKFQEIERAYDKASTDLAQ